MGFSTYRIFVDLPILEICERQIVTDFIADHSVDEPLHGGIENQPWQLYFDGSSHKNGTGIRIVFVSPKNDKAKHKFRIKQFCSNNEAEYEALITGLEIALESGERFIEIRGDSELVLKQLTKEYKCVNESLVMYHTLANALLKRFAHVQIRHLPRIENQEANDLAQMAFVYKIPKNQKQEPIEVKNKRSSKDTLPKKLLKPKLGGIGTSQRHSQGTNLIKILVINNLIDSDW